MNIYITDESNNIKIKGESAMEYNNRLKICDGMDTLESTIDKIFNGGHSFMEKYIIKSVCERIDFEDIFISDMMNNSDKYIIYFGNIVENIDMPLIQLKIDSNNLTKNVCLVNTYPSDDIIYFINDMINKVDGVYDTIDSIYINELDLLSKIGNINILKSYAEYIHDNLLFQDINKLVYSFYSNNKYVIESIYNK